MKKNSIWGKLIISMGLIIVLSTIIKGQETKMMNLVYTRKDILSLFSLSLEDIASQTDIAIQDAKKQIDGIIAVPAQLRSYDSIARPLDYIASTSNYSILGRITHILKMLSPHQPTREAAHTAIIKLQEFAIDNIGNNRPLYKSFKKYANTQAIEENLSADQRYFIQKTLLGFERAGLGLPDDKLMALSELKKEIAKKCLEFERNIAQDNSTIIVSLDDLKGLSTDAISRLKQTEDGNYILGTDYPTIDAVMPNCQVEQTRKKLFIAFNNRAYPANETLLINLLNQRDDLAHQLGYTSYAHFDLENQMILTPENATNFLLDLITHCAPKVAQEYALLISDLPESVTLLPNGKFKPWDRAFLKESYKKKHFNIDQEVISHYFPLEQTIDGLLNVYQLFFDITLKKISVTNTWHEDVQALQVYSKKDQLLGTLFLDLHPRDNKYKHACQSTIVPAIIKEDSSLLPGVSVVVANFPKSTADKPALLKLHNVKTFFHEFGHALHSLLGATSIASLSGINTKRDFVELPSQILEEWLWDKEILTMVSSHYITGHSLPLDFIDNIIALKQFNAGAFVQGQAFFALLCLEYYKEGSNKDPYAIMKKLHEEICPDVAFEPADHMYAAYGHLTSYAAKYYGYLWSQVLALDIFSQIKKEGLLNPIAGKRYLDAILSRGGAQDPNELLYNYLGRKPNNEAFLEDMGLSQLSVASPILLEASVALQVE